MMFEVKTALVALVVTISAMLPIAARQVEPEMVPVAFVREPDTSAVILQLQDAPVVGPDLKDIAIPRPKPDLNTSIAFGPALDSLLALALTAISGLVTWLASWWRRIFKSDMDKRHKEAIHDAAKRGVLWAVAKLKAKFGDNPAVDVKNELLATVGTYLVATVPDALKWFKFDMNDRSEYEDIVTANAVTLGIDINTGKSVGTAFA